MQRSSILLASLACASCASTPKAPEWVKDGEVRGFFEQGCLKRADGMLHSKYFSLGQDTISMTFIFGKDPDCSGKPGVIIVKKRPLPKTEWLPGFEFLWQLEKAGQGYLIVSPGDKARLMLQEVEADEKRFSEAERAASIETGIVPVPLARELCFFRGRISEDGNGFLLKDDHCEGTRDEAQAGSFAGGDLHRYVASPSQSADALYREAEEQYRSALAKRGGTAPSASL